MQVPVDGAHDNGATALHMAAWLGRTGEEYCRLITNGRTGTENLIIIFSTCDQWEDRD